jgi:hypothetical protein
MSLPIDGEAGGSHESLAHHGLDRAVWPDPLERAGRVAGEDAVGGELEHIEAPVGAERDVG